MKFRGGALGKTAALLDGEMPYAFNLDLDTWGLTTKDRELARFRGLLDEEALLKSNALFGYEGDKYYFDIDIRTHFGLNKYTTDTIPYWKTETVEAMDAFQFKEGYSGGAGECVSLAALYKSVAAFATSTSARSCRNTATGSSNGRSCTTP